MRKHYYFIIAFAFAAAALVLQLVQIIVAAFSGWEVMIKYNQFNEGFLELVLLSVGNLYALVYIYRYVLLHPAGDAQ